MPGDEPVTEVYRGVLIVDLMQTWLPLMCC